MDKQKTINAIWRKVWTTPRVAGLKGRLFSEAYPAIRKYFPRGKYNVLEIGTGTGRYGCSLAKDFPQSHFLLTDILKESLTSAKKLAAQLGVSNVEFAQADMLNLSFPENTFDIVFCDSALQLLDTHTQRERIRKQAVLSMVKVLKPSGILILAVPNYWNPHTLFRWIKGKNYEYGFEKSFKEKELYNIAKESKLKVIAIDGFSVAYAFYRQRPRFFRKLIGKILDTVVKILDSFSNRYISRHFGFEIVLIAQK